MKVKELINYLKELDQEREIVLSRDEEGNYFNYLYAIETGVFDPLEHRVHIEKLTNRLTSLGYTEEDLCQSKQGVKVIVLYP